MPSSTDRPTRPDGYRAGDADAYMDALEAENRELREENVVFRKVAMFNKNEAEQNHDRITELEGNVERGINAQKAYQEAWRSRAMRKRGIKLSVIL